MKIFKLIDFIFIIEIHLFH